MRTAAAKGKSWRLIAAGLTVLVAAGVAEANRFTPSSATDLIEKQGNKSLAGMPHAENLAPAFASEPATRFPLLTAADRQALTAPLAGELKAALERAAADLWAEKLASGGQTWGLQPNISGVIQLTTILHPSCFGYARARWYDARNASWLSEDPAQDVDSPNLYSFVAWQPHIATDPMGLQAARDINTFFAPEVAAALASAKEREAQALRQHRLHPGMYGVEGSALRGRLYYLPSQIVPGVRDEGTAWNPFFGGTQAAADLRAYERLHSKEALTLDVALSLSGPGKANKVLGFVGAFGAFVERQQDAGEFRGGPHSETKKPIGDMRDSHHMPARSVSPLDPEAGPAIQMDKPDHALTSSVGTTPEAMEYRATIKVLLDEGEWRAAMLLEIKDVRRVAGTKYNQAIREMLEYATALGLLKK
jgi:hypothetical protein